MVVLVLVLAGMCVSEPGGPAKVEVEDADEDDSDDDSDTNE